MALFLKRFSWLAATTCLLTIGTTGKSAAADQTVYQSYAAYEYQQAGNFFGSGDSKNGYLAIANYYYFLYLDEYKPYPGYLSANLNGYYQNLAFYYYLSYIQAGQPEAALAWYNCLLQYIVPIPAGYTTSGF